VGTKLLVRPALRRHAGLTPELFVRTRRERIARWARGAERRAPSESLVVSCDVPGGCSLKGVVHPGDFRQSESSSNEQVDRKVPDERAQECAKLPGKSRTAGETSLRTRMVGARGVGGRRYE